MIAPRHTAFVGIGSNLGDRERLCLRATELLVGHPAIELVQLSPWYESQAETGDRPVRQPDYLNGAMELATSLDPEALLGALQEVECALGRPRSRSKGAPRTIDLDLLLYDDIILDLPHLTVPHPELAKRLFALRPLCDIAPVARCPRPRLTIREMLSGCERAGKGLPVMRWQGGPSEGGRDVNSCSA